MTHLLREKWGIDKILSRKIDAAVIARFNLDDKKISEYRKNRQDHRHHALDAAVIACIDRSLVKEISTLNAHGSLDRIEPPKMPVEHYKLEKMARSIIVSFKPEHGAQGKLSKETPLGYRNFTGDNGKTEKMYVARTPIATLNEKNISNIVDVKIRSDVREYIACHPSDKIADALQQYGKEHGIKKVRCKTKNQTPAPFGKGSRMRYLDTDDYFAAIIWRIPPYKKCKTVSYKASYIRRTDVSPDGKTILNAAKPHPAAKQLGIVYKGDYLEFFESNRWHKCLVASFSATNNKVVITPLWATNGVSDWVAATPDKMLDRYWKADVNINMISVNVLFGKLYARFITVDPIGRVSVKK